ncbi:MAG TPA: hypothetical protein VD971_01225 [Phycisphaerales bacterium]|nr:hypothetical protein [Phycisphaerales bacterium]
MRVIAPSTTKRLVVLAVSVAFAVIGALLLDSRRFPLDWDVALLLERSADGSFVFDGQGVGPDVAWVHLHVAHVRSHDAVLGSLRIPLVLELSGVRWECINAKGPSKLPAWAAEGMIEYGRVRDDLIVLSAARKPDVARCDSLLWRNVVALLMIGPSLLLLAGNLVSFAFEVVRHRRRRGLGQCRACGYQRDRLVRCPECGHGADAAPDSAG